jgi:hypothetical protein
MKKYLGWFANALLIVGAILIGEKYRVAFLFTFLGEVLWTIRLLKSRQWDMIAICVIFGLIALKNFIFWT